MKIEINITLHDGFQQELNIEFMKVKVEKLKVNITQDLASFNHVVFKV